MATIASTTNALRHVRKTIAFDGGANNGNLGDDVTVFATTGRVILEFFTAYVSEALVCSAPASTNLTIGTPASTTEFYDQPVDYIDGGTGFLNEDGLSTVSRVYPRVGSSSPNLPHALSANLIFNVSDGGAGADITDGTLIVDAWYYPITDDGALAGDDIDAGYMPADVKAWLATAPATPTVAGVPEVDVTHFGGTALTAAAGIPEVKVASIAAAAVTAAAIATDAIDADALAADALTEIFTKVLTTALTESYNADGAAPTLAQAIFLLIGALTEFAISGTTLTVKKLDGTTTAATYTLNSATAPTSRTRAT